MVTVQKISPQTETDMVYCGYRKRKECLYMNEPVFVTINCLNMFYGKKPFEIGRVVRLIKEPDNEYDKEAIGVYLPFIDRVGYIANSAKTVYAGTFSAGRAYDLFDDYAYAKIMFVTHSCAIGLLLAKEDVEQEAEAEEADDAPKKPADSKSTKGKKSGKNPVGFKA